ncbi:MAG: putative zinc-binding metallopeptidase [Candidatus Omnitrophota bacterium]
MKPFFYTTFFLIIICGAPVFAYGQHDVSASINTRIERLEQRFGILFQYRNFPGNTGIIKLSAIPEEEYPRLDEYLSLFEEEINKYPPGFFKGQGVLGIGLATHLFFGERPVQGFYNPTAKVMFFDIARFSRNKAQQRHGIHHEIFHMMFEVKGDFPPLSEEEWSSFNGPDFTYGEKKRFDKPNPYNYYAPREPGFATYYSMEAVREDQAEIFACLMLEQNRRLLEKWIVQDKVLEKKVQAVKDFAKYFHEGMEW